MRPGRWARPVTRTDADDEEPPPIVATAWKGQMHRTTRRRRARALRLTHESNLELQVAIVLFVACGAMALGLTWLLR